MTVSYRPRTSEIPTQPGVYRFFDTQNRVLYVGKASNLRSRLANYFQDLSLLHPRTAAMVTAAHSVEWIEVRNELEALMLEYSLIKQHRPRFNVRLMDDKSYPFLAITIDEQWPRAVVMRGTKRKGTRYFGPYAHAWAIRETLDLIKYSDPHTIKRLVRGNVLRSIQWCVTHNEPISSIWTLDLERILCKETSDLMNILHTAETNVFSSSSHFHKFSTPSSNILTFEGFRKHND